MHNCYEYYHLLPTTTYFLQNERSLGHLQLAILRLVELLFGVGTVNYQAVSVLFGRQLEQLCSGNVEHVYSVVHDTSLQLPNRQRKESSSIFLPSTHALSHAVRTLRGKF